MPRNNDVTSSGGLPLTVQMENFSLSYLHAVAATAGYSVIKSDDDFRGIDVSISRGRDLCDTKNYPIIDPQIVQTTINGSPNTEDGTTGLTAHSI